jgi:hypothetical protein
VEHPSEYAGQARMASASVGAVFSTTTKHRKEVDLARGDYARVQATATEHTINRNLQRRRELPTGAEAIAHSGKLLFERFNELADRRALNLDLRLTGSEVAELRGNIDVGHVYDDSAFHTFGGDIGSSVSRLPVA